MPPCATKASILRTRMCYILHILQAKWKPESEQDTSHIPPANPVRSMNIYPSMKYWLGVKRAPWLMWVFLTDRGKRITVLLLYRIKRRWMSKALFLHALQSLNRLDQAAWSWGCLKHSQQSLVQFPDQTWFGDRLRIVILHSAGCRASHTLGNFE